MRKTIVKNSLILKFNWILNNVSIFVIKNTYILQLYIKDKMCLLFYVCGDKTVKEGGGAIYILI